MATKKKVEVQEVEVKVEPKVTPKEEPKQSKMSHLYAGIKSQLEGDKS